MKKPKFKTFSVYNKTLMISHIHYGLDKFCGISKAMSIENAIKENGFFEDDLYYIREQK